MKRETIPTAPAERAKFQDTKTNRPRSHAWLVIFMIAISVVVGFFGSILARSYPADWLWADKIVISDSVTPELVFVDSGPDTVSSEVINQLRERQGKTIVSIFSGNEINYSDATELGKGIIISNDGWIVLLDKVAVGYNTLTIVLHDGRVFVTDELIQDEYSGIVFAKIDASQLPVIDFRTSNMQLGEPIILYSHSVANADRVSFGQIENLAFSSQTVFTTTHPNLTLLTDHNSRPEYLGSPVFDMTGALVGLNMLDHQILPVHDISRNVFNIFSDKAIPEPRLKLTYTPLYRTVDSDSELIKKGVRVDTIVTSGTDLEINVNVNLNKGDVILSVNEVPLNAQNDLSTLLADLAPTEDIVLEIQRGGKLLNVTILPVSDTL